MGYFPPKYEVKGSSNGYMKLEKGANKFRILSEPLLGYGYWVEFTDDSGAYVRKPKRVPTSQNIPVGEIQENNGLHQFQAFIVWNYKAEAVQILNLTQRTIQRALLDFDRNDDWGDLREYDITITRSGETKENTKYTVMPSPKKELAENIESEFKKCGIKLDALYSTKENPYGGNPFGEAKKKDNTVIDPNDLPF